MINNENKTKSSVTANVLKSGDVSLECEMRRNTKLCKARLRVSRLLLLDLLFYA